MNPPSLPPIERSISVPWNQEAAFERFTTQFGSWWPVRTHSVGGDRVSRVVFETELGGLIYEEHKDGRRFQWGQVLEWDPPRRVRFTWHPSRDAGTAQEVEIAFTPEADGGTRVTLISSHWERWGKNAHRARRGYELGWRYILNVWAGRRTVSMGFVDLLMAVLNLAQKLRGGVDAEIARAGGEMDSERVSRP